MSIISFATALFGALGSIKAILGYVQAFAQGAMLWYVNQSSQATLAEISDAAALAARATTDAERYAAADAWQKALSRPRVSA